MKALNYFGMACAVCVGFASCSSEDENPLEASVVRLASEVIPMTRVTAPNLQSTQIVEGQQVGVTITGASATHNNVAWMVGDEGAMTNTGETLYYGNGEATIAAYHPYNANWNATDASESFTVKTDQSTDAGYLSSDLLWAKKTASKTSDAVALTFEHQLAKINVTLVNDSYQDDLSGATISICGTNITTLFNPITGALTSTDGANITDIKAAETTSTAYTASAIIIPQTVASGTQFIKVEHGGKTFYYTLSEDKTFASKNAYSYTLKVKNVASTELLCVSNNVTNWTENTIEGDNFCENTDEDLTKVPTINLATAGSLSEYIAEEEIATIEKLKISGPLNGDDIIVLRQMLSLNTLDLSDASIVAGGGTYYQSYSTSNNIIGNYMFSGYTNLQTILLPETITAIGIYAFPASLTSIVIPNSVKTIESSAFHSCTGLADVTIGTGVTTIAESAFYGCTALTNVVIPDNVTTMNEKAFYGCTALESVTLSNALTTISPYAFWGCSSLNSLTVPNSVTTIDEYAFYQCSSMTSLLIGNEVTKIGGYAFYECTGLTSLILPAKVSAIGTCAFYKCNFTEVYSYNTSPADVRNINTFSKTEKLYIPAGCTAIYKEKYWGNHFTNIIEMTE